MEINDIFQYQNEQYQIKLKQKQKYSYIYEVHSVYQKSEPFMMFQPRSSRKEMFNLDSFFNQTTRSNCSLENFNNEVIKEKYKSISHPNLLEYLDFQTIKHDQYIMVQKAPSKNLRQYLLLNSLKLSNQEITSIVQQIYSGFLYLKSLKIPYNSLFNLENIYISFNNTPNKNSYAHSQYRFSSISSLRNNKFHNTEHQQNLQQSQRSFSNSKSPTKRKNQSFTLQQNNINHHHQNQNQGSEKQQLVVQMGFYGLEHKHQSDFIQEVQDWQKFGLIIIELISGKTHVSNQNELIYALEDTRKDFRFLAIQIYDYIYKLVHHQLTEDKFISNMKNIVLEIIFQEKLNVFKDEMAPSEAPGIYLPDIVSQIKKSSNNTENYEKTAQCLNSTYISKNNGNQSTCYFKGMTKGDENLTSRSKSSQSHTLHHFDTKTMRSGKTFKNQRIRGPENSSSVYYQQENEIQHEDQIQFQQILEYYENQIGLINFIELGVYGLNFLKESITNQFLEGKYLINQILLKLTYKIREDLLSKNSTDLEKMIYQNNDYKEFDDIDQMENSSNNNKNLNQTNFQDVQVYEEFYSSNYADNYVNYFEDKLDLQKNQQIRYSKKVIQHISKIRLKYLESLSSIAKIQKEVYKIAENSFSIVYKQSQLSRNQFLLQNQEFSAYYLSILIISMDQNEFQEKSKEYFKDYYKKYINFTYNTFQNWLFSQPVQYLCNYIQQIQSNQQQQQQQ